MFSLTSLWKKPNTIKIPIQNYSKEQFQKNMNGILLKKYCNDFYYKSNIDWNSEKKNDSLIPFNNDNDNGSNNNNDNGNNIIIIILASVTSICFYFYKFLKV
jgi:hypothetical protein